MTSSKIMSQSINLFTNPKSNVDSSKSNRASSNFTSVMDVSLKSKQTVSDKDNYSEKKVVINPSKNKITQKDGTENVTNKENVACMKEIKNVSNEEETTSVTDTNESEEVINETVLEEVKTLFSTIENTLTKGLGLTKEELEKQMELLGFSMFDILNLDNLKQLILNVKGNGDITYVLTDETLASTLQELTMEVEEIGQENQLNLTTEEFNQVFNQVMDDSINKNVDLEVEDYAGEVESKDTKAPEVQIIVEKDVPNNSTEYSKSSEETNTTEKTNNTLDTIMNNLAGINNDNPLNFTDEITKVNEVREIVSQIVEQIKIHIKPDQTSMELQLNPEHLGKLQLSVVSKEGVLTAHFTTSNQAVKEAIESQMVILRDNLTNQGLKVDAIEVTVSNFEFSGSNEAQSDNNSGNSKKRRFLYDDDNVIADNNAIEESEAMNKIKEQNGTTVDYSA